MVYSMSGFIERYHEYLQNLLMILMEICLILEFILLIFQNYAFWQGNEKILASIFCMAGCLISFYGGTVE